MLVENIMSDKFRKALLLIFRNTFCLLFIIITKAESSEDYLYYRAFIKHSNNSACEHVAPTATFTAYVNGNLDRILIDDAPRWDTGGDPNITGKGVFGVEFGNFTGPGVEVGDTINFRFSCNSGEGEQGFLSAEVTGIPWTYFPQFLYLAPASLPTAPQGLSISLNESHNRILKWNQEAGVSYSVYRRVVQDTIADGRSRKMYLRVGKNIISDTWTDSTTTDSLMFGYIIYATSSAGITSSHSSEVVDAAIIPGLSATPRTTTATLKWNYYTPVIGSLKGFNIYRRTDSGSYAEPIAYIGCDTNYTDSRLMAGTNYFYKVKARISEDTELGESEEIAVTTNSSPNGLYTYANMELAVVVYQNTNGGSISDAEVDDIKEMLEVAKLFYWRNSGMKLNVKFHYYLLSEYHSFGAANEYWASMLKTVSDLESLGVMNTQYDIIFRITPAIDGYWSYGVQELGLPGPARKTGFSHTQWPISSGVIYPGKETDINYKLTWVFIHEVQHALDALYNANGHEEMYHGDSPYLFPVACGEQLDFQAKMFRTFDAYEDLYSNWGDIFEAIDADNDGFPDNDESLALDELRFGSKSDAVDTDNDGYSDRQEAIDGAYEGSDPNNSDTDGDGVIDGQDQFVRFPVQTTIKRYTPVLDGTVENNWPLMDSTVSFTQKGYNPKLYLSYDDDYLYLALYLSNIGIPEIVFDFQADGWFHSSGNTRIKINPSTGEFTTFRSWDASPEVQAYNESLGGSPDGMWDDNSEYLSHFNNRRVIFPAKVKCSVKLTFPVIQIEMAIPKREYAGLYLQPGDSIGININYSKVNNDASQWAVTFDQYNFMYFVFGEKDSTAIDDNFANAPETFYLSQNYPNPFNAETGFEYGVPISANIEISVYDLIGRRIAILKDEAAEPGRYKILWNGKDNSGKPAPNGIYLCKMTSSNGNVMARKMILLK